MTDLEGGVEFLLFFTGGGRAWRLGHVLNFCSRRNMSTMELVCTNSELLLAANLAGANDSLWHSKGRQEG